MWAYPETRIDRDSHRCWLLICEDGSLAAYSHERVFAHRFEVLDDLRAYACAVRWLN
jgi:hypothetical protein